MILLRLRRKAHGTWRKASLKPFLAKAAEDMVALGSRGFQLSVMLPHGVSAWLIRESI